MAEEQPTTPEMSPQAPAAPEPGAAPSPGSYPALDWRQGLREELRGDPTYNKTLEVYPDQNTFVRDALGWRREVQQRVRLPGEQATPEEWQAYYKQLPGWVETPNDYAQAITLPALAPDGQEATQEWDPTLLQGIYSTAHAHGILPRQLQPLIDEMGRAALNAKHIAEAEEAKLLHDQERELQRRFGANVVTQTSKARHFWGRLSGDTELGQRVWQLFEDSGLGNHPDLVQWSALSSERWGEPPDLLSDGLFPMTPTRDEVQTERSKLTQTIFDPKVSPADQRAAVQRLQRLEAQALALQR